LAELARQTYSTPPLTLAECLERIDVPVLCENAASQEFDKYGNPKQTAGEWDLNGFFA
jgi:hypothetical protein